MNIAAFTTQCRNMRGQLKIHARDRIANATTLNLGCRGIGPETEKKLRIGFLLDFFVYVGF